MPLFCDAPRAATFEGVLPLAEGIDKHPAESLNDVRRVALGPATETSHQEHPFEFR